MNVDGHKEPAPTLVDEGRSEKSVDELLSTQRSRAAVPPPKLKDLVLEQLTSGATARKYLDKLAEERYGTTPDMLYRNALLPLKKDGKVKAVEESFDEGWCWKLVADA